MTIKDISKQIEINVEFGGIETNNDGIETASFRLKGSLLKTIHGLQWNSIPEIDGVAIGDEVSISCAIELRKVIESPNNGEFKLTEIESQITM